MGGELWQQQARAMGGDDLVAKVEQMADDIHDIKAVMTTLNKAFPSGDIDGHRRYHEAVIERNAELRRLRVAIQEKTISGLIWIAIVWMGSRAWAAVAARFSL